MAKICSLSVMPYSSSSGSGLGSFIVSTEAGERRQVDRNDCRNQSLVSHGFLSSNRTFTNDGGFHRNLPILRAGTLARLLSNSYRVLCSLM